MAKQGFMSPSREYVKTGKITRRLEHLSDQMVVHVNKIEEIFTIDFGKARIVYGGPAFGRDDSGKCVLKDTECYAPVQLAAHTRLWDKLKREECRLSSETLEIIKNANCEYKELIDSSENRRLTRTRIKLDWFFANLQVNGTLETFGWNIREEERDVLLDRSTYSEAKGYIEVGMKFYVDFMEQADGSLPAISRAGLEDCLVVGKRITSTYSDLISNCENMLLEYERTKKLLG